MAVSAARAFTGEGGDPWRGKVILPPSRSEREAKAWRTFSSNLFGFIFGGGHFFSNIAGSTALPKPSPA